MATDSSGRSLRRAYLEWVDEQIEEFKETVSRSDLLRIADEVVQELRVTQGGQYQLTELLLWNAVDRKIFRLLGLPGYRRWRAMRHAPQEKTLSDRATDTPTIDACGDDDDASCGADDPEPEVVESAGIARAAVPAATASVS